VASPPAFNQFNLVVSDMEASLAFYRRLGVVVRDTDPAWAAHHRSAVMPDGLDLDFDSVEFARRWDRGWDRPAGGGMGVLGFGFASRDDVDAAYADLVGAGYRGQQEPYDAFWGARYAVVEDPDGNAVGLMSPIDDTRKTAVEPPG
jgi:catechol 2,3-dioxygenase-like lactoylglutathione lyase family enzyme